MLENTAIIIPARLASTRLPKKPLANINGKSMIVHVYEKAKQSGIKNIFVACSEIEIADEIHAAGGEAILTNPDLPSGTDRIYEALQKSGKKFDYIVNVQGDLPTLDPSIINTALELLKNDNVDIATLAAPIKEEHEKVNPNIVKAVIAFNDNKSGKALYFTRCPAPYGEGDLYHHIGLYAFKAGSLKKFVALEQSQLEKREKLEQLRALENGMRIDIALVDSVPIGVDTQQDLDYVRNIMANQE